MKKNMSIADKAVRLIVAAVLIILFFAKVITGTWAIVAIILAVVLVLTSLISFCPLYTVLGLNTIKKN